MDRFKFIADESMSGNVVAFVGPQTERLRVPASEPEGWIIGIGWTIHHEPAGHDVIYEVPKLVGVITDLADPTLEGK